MAFVCISCARRTTRPVNEESSLNNDYTLTMMEISDAFQVGVKINQGKFLVRDNASCKLELKIKSIGFFRHAVKYSNLAFVFLRLNMNNGLTLRGSNKVVGENVWIWTFYGKTGGLKFLKWPYEFGIWSVGILNTFVGGPLDVDLFNTSGDCSNLTVGDERTDMAISKALVNLTEAMISLDGNDQRYGPSFWCYKRRTYIKPKSAYYLCKHILCPIEALEYTCRSYFYNPETERREISFHEFVFRYDTLWWIGPFIAAIVLFAFSPLLLLHLAASANDWLQRWKSLSDNDFDQCIYIDGTDHVTLVKTLLGPMCISCHSKRLCSARTLRSLLPFFSLAIVGLQILLDYLYLHAVVVLSTDKAVPMGFRSMLAGYKSSSLNFLPWFGGPFIGLGLYLFVTSFLVSIPASFSDTLESGLSDVTFAGSSSPLSLSFDELERFGSVIITKRHGFKKVFRVFLAQFYLVINIRFWRFVYNHQSTRWKSINSLVPACCFLVPFYMVFCMIEILLCLLKYGCPIISFAIVIYSAYSGLLYRALCSRVWKVVIWTASACLILSIMFSFFMFGTVFLDACLFFSRICIFTFTGIVVYPRVSYGYMIFIATIIFYLWECIQNFSAYYSKLLRVIVSVCESIQQANDTDPFVVRQSHYKGIKAWLFNDVIELYFPRRKKVFTSLLQMSIIICILGMSVHLLMQTEKFQELHTIMHVGTTLFICAFPKIVKSMCCSRENKFLQRRQRAEIKVIVKRCLNYFSDEESSDDE